MKINTLKEGSNRLTALTGNLSKATTKAGKPYLSFELSDNTGSISCKIWDPDIAPGLTNGQIVIAEGEVNTYNGSLQMTVRKVRKAEAGEYKLIDIYPTTPYDVGMMKTELMRYCQQVQNEDLHALLLHFLDNFDFNGRFVESSAAVGHHHAFIGGLLQHTLETVKAAVALAGVFPNEVSRDLVITGAVLHDIGKIREYSRFPYNSVTEEGAQLGHIYIGAEMVHDACIRCGIPEAVERDVKHIILSHHGKLEWGSPKTPYCLEALIVHFSDNFSATAEMMIEFIKGGKKMEGQAGYGYSRILGNSIGHSSCKEERR